MIPDFVTIGPLIVDELLFSSAEPMQDEPGGSLLYSSLAANLWPQQTGVVSVAGMDYPKKLLEKLAKRKINQKGLRFLNTPGHRFRIIYEGGSDVDRGGTKSTPLSEACPLPSDFPQDWLKTRGIHLAPYTLSRQAEMIDHLEGKTKAILIWDSADIMNSESKSEFVRLIEKVDGFFPSDRELALPGVQEDPHSVMRSLAKGKLRWLGFKRGKKGVLLYDRDGDRFLEEPALTNLNITDPTGAGDTFCSTFLSAYLAHKDLALALRWATTASSLTLENKGAEGLWKADFDQLKARYAQNY